MRLSSRSAGPVFAVMAVAACGAGALRAQDGTTETPTNLNVWIVRPATAADRAVLRAQQDIRDISVYREATAGSFGKSASETGQTAGSYGKPASETGQNASNAGVNAGSYGQTASSLPSNVPSQAAGSYGQTAGSFGTTAGDFHGAPVATATASESAASRTSKGVLWTNFLSALHEALPSLQVRFTEVLGVELRQRMAAVANTPLAPDVLLSDRMPDGWAVSSQGSVLVALGPDRSVDGARGARRQGVYRDAYGMARSPHASAERVFLEWWRGEDLEPALRHERLEGRLPAAADAALSAVGQVLNGAPLDGLADKELAEFSSVSERTEVLGASSLPGDLQFPTVVMRAENNARFAVVLLHTQCASRTAYCDLYSTVMLRADEHRAWKVLQLSLGMDAGEAADSFELAANSAEPAEKLAEVAMPKLASPADGDQRAARSGLDVWFDNGGGASTVAVEWQAVGGGSPAASHLLLVPDTEATLQTRVPAPFLGVSGPVRWRVWALGKGGALRLTGWRTVTVVQ